MTGDIRIAWPGGLTREADSAGRRERAGRRPRAMRRAGHGAAVLSMFLLAAGQLATTLPAPTLAETGVRLPTETLAAPGMQSVNAPARIARVATVPGSPDNEAWAIGYSRAVHPGWQSNADPGQVLFLHYTDESGWQIAGPPTLPTGAVFSGRLLSLALAQSGEGWAVGEKGTIVHHQPGYGWAVTDNSPTDATLESVSLVPSGSTGWAVGAPKPNAQAGSSAMTILRLQGGSWQQEALPATLGGANPPTLMGVSAVDGDIAWAVSGEGAQSTTATVNSQALYVFYRNSSGWQQLSTKEGMFDSPPATAQDGKTPITGAAGGAVAATSDGAWVVGRLQPRQTGTVLGDQLTGDSSRPFAIWFQSPQHGSLVSSYCPGIDQVQSNGQPMPQDLCDKEVPLTGFGLTAVTSFANSKDSSGQSPDEAFAGGMGLLHFTPGSGIWRWEQDSVGFVAAIGMASPQEGWVAGSGGNAAGAGVLSDSIALGHWTRHPQVPAIAAWPDPSRFPAEAVATDPDGSGQALAVGTHGTRMHYVPNQGWILHSLGINDLHALSWPTPKSAWAVGNNEDIFHWDGLGWDEMTGPTRVYGGQPDNLFGVAFNSSGRGWAVGSGATILDYSGGRWRRDPNPVGLLSQTNLYTVATVPGGAIAAGGDNTVLVFRGGGWSVDADAANALPAGGPPVTFYASASLPDGWAALGGTGGVVLLRSPAGSYELVQPGVDGTVIALGLSGAGRPAVVASVDPGASVKYFGGKLAATQGWVYVHADDGWHDVELNHRVTVWESTDTAAPRDPVLGFALDPKAIRGWAAGGYPADTLDDETHSYEDGGSTGSLDRLDVTGDPRPPSEQLALPGSPGDGFRFAFLSDSACGGGLCGPADGTGIMADSFLQRAQADINLVNPDLNFFGGDMRRSGLTAELDVVKRILGGFHAPVYGAIGAQDLLSNTTVAGQSTPGTAAGSGNGYYLHEFGDAPAPWGTVGGNSQGAPAGVRPVEPPGTLATGQARTHYAFDYAPEGLPPQVRFIVLNDSDGTLTDGQANPAASDASSAQETWLASVLNTSLPTIIVMNAPTEDPRNLAATPPPLDQASVTSFEQSISAHLPSAVFSGFYTANLHYPITAPNLPAKVDAYISGGAGSPIDPQGTHNPFQGDYHAWLLVTVKLDQRNALGQAPVVVQSMPIIDTLAMTINPVGASPEGVLPAGTPSIVTAIGRTPDAGLSNVQNPSAYDPLQARTQYVTVPNPLVDQAACVGIPHDYCSVPSAQDPYHYFKSGDDKIAEFVKPCYTISAPVFPCLDQKGQLIPDDQDGYLCAKSPGSTWIDAVVGIHRVRQQITVGPGFGKCIKKPVLPPPPTIPKPPIVPNIQVPAPAAAPVAPGPAPRLIHHPIFHGVIQNPLVAAVVPPPVPVLAAAPPLPAAGTAAKKEEEREKAFEHSKESGDGGHQHQAVAVTTTEPRWDAKPVAAAGAAAMGMLIFGAAWVSARRRSSPAVIDVRRWE